ncbi:ribonucleotide reductase [Bacillus sp. JJ864]|uniref:ribonucleotide reductase n=1 Tax=Bacillus sp. JJ864 TaxID=3122975 RepID=UPI002FFEDED0
MFQLQETSVINDYGTDDIIRRDINCNLGSLNIVNVMENKEIREAVHAGMEALTAVSDMTIIPNAPTVKKANEELHSVGLGAMNLHGYLAKNKIAYESAEAKEFARTFFMMLNYYSIEKSMEIAKEKGVTFKDFEKSDYANGTYFEKYETTDYIPVTEKVQQLFEGIHVPTKEDWTNLKEQVQKHGLYNSYRLAIAPTQSISYVQNATSSVMPIVSQIESRTYANATTYYPMPYLSKDTFWYYKSSYDMNQFKLIDLIAEIQEHIDQGISTILYVNSDISTRELARYYIYAHKKGLKSLYYTRTRKLSVEECVACTV